MVKGALAETGMPPHRLQLEITENVLLQNTFATLATLHELRKLGVQVALDDFGTGYSSLSYLRSFPFDKIKIDRSFIQDLSNGVEPVAIVQAVANLAKCLNMASTAEGVETQQQLELLQSIGCTEMQGYLFSRAKPASEIRQFFEQRPGQPDGSRLARALRSSRSAQFFGQTVHFAQITAFLGEDKALRSRRAEIGGAFIVRLEPRPLSLIGGKALKRINP